MSHVLSGPEREAFAAELAKTQLEGKKALKNLNNQIVRLFKIYEQIQRFPIQNQEVENGKQAVLTKIACLFGEFVKECDDSALTEKLLAKILDKITASNDKIFFLRKKVQLEIGKAVDLKILNEQILAARKIIASLPDELLSSRR